MVPRVNKDEFEIKRYKYKIKKIFHRIKFKNYQEILNSKK